MQHPRKTIYYDLNHTCLFWPIYSISGNRPCKATLPAPSAKCPHVCVNVGIVLIAFSAPHPLPPLTAPLTSCCAGSSVLRCSSLHVCSYVWVQVGFCRGSVRRSEDNLGHQFLFPWSLGFGSTHGLMLLRTVLWFRSKMSPTGWCVWTHDL